MSSYVKWFSYEVFADPHDNCVPGSNVSTDAANLDAYLEHIPRLAMAGGTAWAPKDTTPAEEAELSTAIAGSVARAYPKNVFFNLGKYACSTSGNLTGCGCTIAGAYNTQWDSFATW